MRLYRVFPWLASAREGQPGHALYLPEPGGAGRVDNPAHYRTLYLSDSPAGAVTEAFGTLRLWTTQMFLRPDLPGSVRAIAEYNLAGESAIFDLDDADSLASLGLRPSQVVTRERAVTRRWALAIHEQGRWAGVRWWSYYDPAWYFYAVWDLTALTFADAAVQPLSIDAAPVVEAAQVLGRPRHE